MSNTRKANILSIPTKTSTLLSAQLIVESEILCIPYIVNRNLYWCQEAEDPPEFFDDENNAYWRGMAFRKMDEVFYLSFSFIEHKSSFVIFVYFANLQRANLKYAVNMYLEQAETVNPHRLKFEGFAVHIEDVMDVSSYEDLPPDSYWTVPKDVLSLYQTHRKNDLDEFFTVHFPVFVESIMKIESAVL